MIPPELMQNVQLYYNEMQQARQNYLSYLTIDWRIIYIDVYVCKEFYSELK